MKSHSGPALASSSASLPKHAFTTNQLTPPSQLFLQQGSHDLKAMGQLHLTRYPSRALNETNTQGYAWEKEFAEQWLANPDHLSELSRPWD